MYKPPVRIILCRGFVLYNEIIWNPILLKRD